MPLYTPTRRAVGTVLALALGAITAQDALANAFASNLRVTQPTSETAFDGNFGDGTGARIRFRLNEQADQVVVSVRLAGSVIYTTTLTNAPKGDNSVLWNGTVGSGTVAAPAGTYTYDVTTSDAGNAAFTELWGFSDIAVPFDSLSSRAVLSVTDPTNPRFGQAYFIEAGTGRHFFSVLNNDGSLVAEGLAKSYPNFVQTVTTSPWYSDIAQDNRIYVNNQTNAAATAEFAVFNLDGSLYRRIPHGGLSVRGLAVSITGTDTTIRYVDATSVKTKVNSGAATTGFTRGYLRTLDYDDAGNVYVSGGTSSTSYTKLYKLNPAGVVVDSVTATGNINSVNVDRRRPGAADDRVYVFVLNAGLAQVNFSATPTTPSTSTIGTPFLPTGSTSGSTNIQIAADAAGNIIIGNPNNEVMYLVSPPDGPNTFTTVNPTGQSLVVVTVLPVELSQATAARTGSDVSLTWNTASEKHNAGFSVQRQTGSTWTALGFVGGHGTTAEVQRYSFTDRNAPRSAATYRLVQRDLDGTEHISATLSVEAMNAPATAFRLLPAQPNPFNPTTTLRFELPTAERVTLAVYNSVGQRVAVLLQDELRTAGANEVRFDASALPSGTYLYRVNTSNRTLAGKLTLVK